MLFKCVNCGGNTIYDPEKATLFCPYCDGVNCGEEKYDHAQMEICPNCGGEVVVKEHSSAVKCAYCDHSIILDERVEDRYLPYRMIPFKLGREKVKELLKNKFKKAIFTPTDFLSEAQLKKMQGEYVPFWMYDYHTDARLNATGIKVRVWVAGNTEYTEKSFFQVRREMNISYEDIPADASIAMPDSIMDLMEPYDYKALVPFSKKYLSGFLGEKYNMDAEAIESRAHMKMEKSAEQKLRSTVSGYSSVTDQTKIINVLSHQHKYDLLPVWKYDYAYKGQIYPFYINGQTGKIVGKLPVSVPKVMAYSATLWATLTASIAMVGFIVSHWM